MAIKSYKLASYNCKNVKRSIDAIRELCRTSDLICLQETWLLPHDLSYLDSIDVNFGCTGTSAVDTTAGMLRGRPHGGVAVLWRKSAFSNVSVVQCDNPRVCAIKIAAGQRSILVLSVYMPTDVATNLPEFTDCLSLVSAIIDSSNIECCYILGDFNAHPATRFYSEMKGFCDELEWILQWTQNS